MGLGFVYKATDQKKLTMRKRSREPNRDGCYKQHGKVMDNRWRNQFHQNIHAAGNSSFHT